MGFSPQLRGVGPCPAQCIWQGSGFAADQTNAMLAVVRSPSSARRRPLAVVRSPSSERTTNPSSRRKRQDSLSLSLVLFPPKPLHWVSAGALLGEVIKLPFCIFSTLLRGGGITTLGVRFMPLKRWTRRSYGGVFVVFMPPQNSSCAG